MRWGLRTGASLAAAAALWAGPACAQLDSEAFVDNHRTRADYSLDYTPGTGASRALIAIVFSEYGGSTDRDAESAILEARLGAVPLRTLGTRENRDRNSKHNRMTAFYLPEGEIPPGTSEFYVRYGPAPSSSMIYIATARRIRQDTLAATPAVFEAGCSRQSGSNPVPGTLPFAPITAEPSDLVLSFVGTGDQDARTTFRNGGDEFLDRRVTGPGFSLAGALQSPQSAVTISGEADVSDGCHRRPVTMQMRLRPLGQDGVLTAPPEVVSGDRFTIQVADEDLNLRTSTVDTARVRVTNPRTGQTVTLTLTETGPDTGVFTATLDTGAPPQGLDIASGDDLALAYDDALTATGRTATRTLSVGVGAPGRLAATKTVTAPGFLVPGEDAFYAITVTNEGNGPIDDGTVFLVDALPARMRMLPGAGVGFAQDRAGLDFDEARDVGYAPAGAKPASFADCGGGPADAAYLCVAPDGAMAAGAPDPSFTVTFGMRID